MHSVKFVLYQKIIQILSENEVVYSAYEYRNIYFIHHSDIHVIIQTIDSFNCKINWFEFGTSFEQLSEKVSITLMESNEIILDYDHQMIELC